MIRYGIGSFVYTSRRPFHPKRLWELMKDPFCILQDPTDSHDDDEEAEGEEDEEEEEETKDQIFARLQAEKEELDLPSRIKFKRNSPIWKGVLRSKGFVWLATRHIVSGEWSQAGCMWTLNGGAPWMAAMDESLWPTDDEEIKDSIKSDFFGPWGDRRQEGEP
jgi:G3E family GTPase